LSKRKALKTVFIVMLVCALVFVAYEIFTVRYINVNGCKTLSADSVVALSGIKKGELVFDVNTKKVTEAIGTNPYLKPVSVKVEYPNKVDITVQERKEAAYLQEGSTVLLIDDECWLLKINNGANTGNTEVTGISLGAYKIGERLNASDDYQLDMLSEVLKEIESSGAVVKSIDMSIAADVVLKFDNGFKAEIGDDTGLDNKFKLIKSSIEKLKSLGKTGGTIDVVTGTNAYYREK
jgi:hypothetical protein